MDPRARQLAELVLDHSIHLERGDRLLLQFDPRERKYPQIITQEAIKRGAEVRLDQLSHNPRYLKLLLSQYNMHEFRKELERRKELAQWCTTRILIDCISDERILESVPDFEKRAAEFDERVIGPYKEVLYRPGPHEDCEVRWNIVGYPGDEGARRAGMSFKEYEDFVYAASLDVDWKRLHAEMRRVKGIFDYAKDVEIFVPGSTEVRFSLADRGGKICDGISNRPDGEVFYAPVEDSIEGYATFQLPSLQRTIIEGIRLEFEKGTIVKGTAKKGKKALDEILKITGANRIGEFGIGCNYAIQRPVLETLYDEKIGGTFHFALGKAISKNLHAGGGHNTGNIHWDIVCDLRRDPTNLQDFPGGEMYVNGELVQKNGIWK